MNLIFFWASLYWIWSQSLKSGKTIQACFQARSEGNGDHTSLGSNYPQTWHCGSRTHPDTTQSITHIHTVIITQVESLPLYTEIWWPVISEIIFILPAFVSRLLFAHENHLLQNMDLQNEQWGWMLGIWFISSVSAWSLQSVETCTKEGRNYLKGVWCQVKKK